MKPPELMAADFYYQDRLRQAENRRQVKLALDGAPHRPSVLRRLFSALFSLLRKPARAPEAQGRLISQSDPYRKVA